MWSCRVPWPLLILVILLMVAAFSFVYLDVSDRGEYLQLRYGPLPLFHKRFRYARMTAATPDRTTSLDGWGIHYMPFRGWTYNLWGFDCVKVQLGPKTVRIGTDDPQGLAQFLQSRIARRW
jgi:hypothetical protein